MNVQNRKLQTPLHLAVQQAHVGLVLLLVDAGCSIDAEDEDGDTALHVALQRHQLLPLAADGAGGDPGPLQLLSRVRKCGAGCGPWHLAAGSGHGLSDCPLPPWVTARSQAVLGWGSLGDCGFAGITFCSPSHSSMAGFPEILCPAQPGKGGAGWTTVLSEPSSSPQ